MTAAHCVDRLRRGLDCRRVCRVGLGHVARNQISDFYGVTGVDVHSGYNPFTSNGNDLAMLRLDRPAPYAPLRVIRTDESAKWAPPATATIIGWGHDLIGGGPASNALLEATAPMVSRFDLRVRLRLCSFDRNTMVCAGNGATDTCQGDSGGPLMVPDGPNARVLAGVTSWGQGCADAGLPRRLRATRAPQLNSWVMRRHGRRRRSPSAGQNLGPTVTLTSTSANTDGGTFDSLLWDFDTDGQYDDAGGANVSHTFLTTGGAFPVGLWPARPTATAASTRQTMPNQRPRRSALGGPERVLGARRAQRPAGRQRRPTRRRQALAYRWDLNGDRTFEGAARRRRSRRSASTGRPRRASPRSASATAQVAACTPTATRSSDECAAAGERGARPAGEAPRPRALVPHARDGSRAATGCESSGTSATDGARPARVVTHRFRRPAPYTSGPP